MVKAMIHRLKFDSEGLIPAIVQDHTSGEVLMLAYMNSKASRKLFNQVKRWFWSRSRAELWHKGATSGHTQEVKDIRIDCDGDTLLVRVVPQGPACHTGERTVFLRT
jgi:phosphoribosyl-ATP pyrophosphohydrolase/phosphoribosyl-AMP cyclohydrolase